MAVRVIVAVLGLLNGGWMVFDGIHVLVNGKYFGPETPGPWSRIVAAVGIDPFKIGPAFILLGAMWIAFAASLLARRPWSPTLGIVLGIATLWYLPLGTVLSIAALALLVAFRSSF